MENIRKYVAELIGTAILVFVGCGSAAALGVSAEGGHLAVALGSNGTGTLGISGSIVAEIILTFIFVFTILGVTSDSNKSSIAGVVIGLTLALVHIIGIPLTGTSVNPARSIGPALLTGGDALKDVWVFIVGPLIGAAIAAFTYKFLYNVKE